MAYEKDPNDLGACWEKQGQYGTYMTGLLEIDGVKIPIVLFKTKEKKSEKSPDWRILKSKPKEAKNEVAAPPLNVEFNLPERQKIQPLDEIPFN